MHQLHSVAAILILATACGSSWAQDTQGTESRPSSAPTESQPASKPASQPTATPGGADCPPVETGPKRAYPITGAVSLSYRGRTGDGSADNDVYGYLVLDGGNQELDDAIFHLMGRVTYDFEGSSPGDPYNSLNDIDGKFDQHVYEAFAELRRGLLPSGLGLERVRIGRQDVYAAVTYLVDGIRLDFKPQKACGNMQVSVFGGIPEYLYDDEHAGDWIAGFNVAFEPWCDARMNVQYAYVQDDTAWNGFNVNNFASVTLRQQVSDCFGVWAEASAIDAGIRDAAFRVDWVDLRHDFEIHSRYRYQATITSEYTTPYDPYVGVLGTSFAYHQIDIDAAKLFCNEHLGIDCGISGRLLQDASDETTFNHEYVRLFATVSAYRWPCEDIDLSLTGELWHAPGDDSQSLGGEITWRATDKLRMSAGSYYSLYKSDLFTVDERQDATTIFLRAGWKKSDCLQIDGRIEYESSSDGDFFTGIIGLTWRF